MPDRDRVVERLHCLQRRPRLSKDEHDGRLENALSARTYADLDQLVTDLPAARATAVASVAKTNGLALASLICGLAPFIFGCRRPSRRSYSATWPGTRSSAPENRGLAGARRLDTRLGDGDPGHRPHRRHVRRDARHHAPELSIRASGTVAALTWKILTKLRCCPWRAGKLARGYPRIATPRSITRMEKVQWRCSTNPACRAKFAGVRQGVAEQGGGAGPRGRAAVGGRRTTASPEPADDHRAGPKITAA